MGHENNFYVIKRYQESMGVKFWEDYLHTKTTMLITVICTLSGLTIYTHVMSVDTLKFENF